MSHAPACPIRVFLVDDSPLALVLLKRILLLAPEINVVGTARSAREALGAFEAARPDVICIGHHLPALDGVALIGQTMASFPRPILAIGAQLDPHQPEQILSLLAAGAVDVIAMPDAAHSPHQDAALVQKIKLLSGVIVISRRAATNSAAANPAAANPAAANPGTENPGTENPGTETKVAQSAIPDNRALDSNGHTAKEAQSLRNGEAGSRVTAQVANRVSSRAAPPVSAVATPHDKAGATQIAAPIGAVSNSVESEAPPVLRAYAPHTIRIVAVGASTGGPQVLQRLLAKLPTNLNCPVVCVQHISEGFLQSMIDWLDEQCRVRIKIAANGEVAQVGTVYFPPENYHLEIDEGGSLRCLDAPPLGGHRPAVTVLFESVARAYGRHALGILLTGMGSDGASGLEAIMLAGGATIAQDEASCVVFGMPRQAIARGAAHFILTPEQISTKIERLLAAS